MPLTQLQMDLALDEVSRSRVQAIHGFLSANKGLAYTPAELAAELQETEVVIAAILEKLDDLNFVESGLVEGSLYFIYRSDLPPLR